MRGWHHKLRFLHQVRTWHLVVLLLFFVSLSVVLLRQNNLGMIERRNIVKMADQQNGDVQAALQELQSYVASHMNTSMGDRGLYLEKTYQRAYDRAVQQAVERHSVSNTVYQQADAECQAQFSRTASFTAYVQCVSDKVSALAPTPDTPNAITAPPTDLFRYNFVSPLWSPDAAGLSLLVTLALAIMLLLRVGLRVWLDFAVKRQRG